MSAERLLALNWSLEEDPEDSSQIIICDDKNNKVTSIQKTEEHYCLQWNETIVAMGSLEETYAWILEHFTFE